MNSLNFEIASFYIFFCSSGIGTISLSFFAFDLTKALEKHNKTAAKVDKMDSERALLGFLLAKIGKIDPDIIIGHDVFGFDMEVLLHRTVLNKIPNW